MTETLSRHATLPPRPTPAERAGGPWAAGALGALRAGVVGLLLVGLPGLALWYADDRSGTTFAQTARGLGQLWLLAHAATLEVPGGRVTLAPLGLCVLPLLLLARAAARASRDSRAGSVADVARVALATALPYALLTGLVSVLSRGPDVYAPLPQAVLAGLVLGALGAAAGALRPGRLWRAGWWALPARVRLLAPAVAGASGVLLAGGAVLVGAVLALHLDRAADLAATTRPGPAGGAGLLLLGLCLVPNAVVWGTSWLAGPGFAIGTGTGVGPFGYALGDVPAFPLLAALPSGEAPGWAVVGLLLPVLAGAVAGVLLLTGLRDRRHPVLETLAVGPVCGVLWAGICWGAAGAVGGQRLSSVGPSPVAVGLCVAAEVGVGALAAVLVLRRRDVPTG